MLVLGLSGGLVMPHEDNFRFQFSYYHDAAAVLIEDGKVIEAIEEERLSRHKHTSKFPANAIRHVLKQRGISLADLDAVAFYGDEKFLNTQLTRFYFFEKGVPGKSARVLIKELFAKTCNQELDDAKLRFVPHHVTHAMSAFAMSGFDESLVVTIDAGGDDDSGLVASVRDGKWETLWRMAEQDSIGTFYIRFIRYLGFDLHDEYKVMGLAPYGKAEQFRPLVETCYSLLPDGRFKIHYDVIDELHRHIRPRRKGDPVEQSHKDLAASLQQSLERLCFHVVDHFLSVTGHKSLCLAGGVAHNCTMNGKLLASGKAQRLFVQPASHDAGCALGAALEVYKELSGGKPIEPLKHVYWGTPLPSDIPAILNRWKSHISFEPIDDVAQTTAKLLAAGSVIGWVQGRSEFGPRALGSRSIIADPRPYANRERINAMVKKREGFRPFAPSVKGEAMAEFFEVAPTAQPGQFDYMTFVVKVREDKRELLGAITHVDGSARVQTISAETNPLYWKLTEEFGKLTGVPMVLNTSFNNNKEPIVDSVEDAVVSFLTTELDQLVIGDYLVRKNTVDAAQAAGALYPSLPSHVRLVHRRVSNGDGFSVLAKLELSQMDWLPWSIEISEHAHDILFAADGVTSATRLIEQRGLEADEAKKVLRELVNLWADRAVILLPYASTDKQRQWSDGLVSPQSAA